MGRGIGSRGKYPLGSMLQGSQRGSGPPEDTCRVRMCEPYALAEQVGTERVETTAVLLRLPGGLVLRHPAPPVGPIA